MTEWLARWETRRLTAMTQYQPRCHRGIGKSRGECSGYAVVCFSFCVCCLFCRMNWGILNFTLVNVVCNILSLNTFHVLCIFGGNGSYSSTISQEYELLLICFLSRENVLNPIVKTVTLIYILHHNHHKIYVWWLKSTKHSTILVGVSDLLNCVFVCQEPLMITHFHVPINSL